MILNKQVAVPGLCCCLLGAGLLAYKLWHRESLPEAAEHLRSCGEAMDSDCMWSYADKPAAAAAGLTKDKFQRFVERFVAPKLKGSRRQSVPVLTEAENGGFCDSTVMLLMPDKRRAGLGFPVVPAKSGGAVCPRLLHQLLFAAFMAEVPADKPLPKGIDRARYLAESYRRHAPELEALGITGLAERPVDNFERVSVLTWVELAERYESKIAIATTKPHD